ncbi:hypothetical protein Fot_05808 [Forsythia ovata]|uniref:Uncharacterized protein n=1 Tax=Forsythia ovata TaxID=205694 RepID=A0ABD1WR91_9LAMI
MAFAKHKELAEALAELLKAKNHWLNESIDDEFVDPTLNVIQDIACSSSNQVEPNDERSPKCLLCATLLMWHSHINPHQQWVIDLLAYHGQEIILLICKSDRCIDMRNNGLG